MNDNYQNLANAIILQAVDDYRKALRTLSLYPYDRDACSEEQSIKRFFRSGWFKVLTNLDPEALIERLNKEVAA